MATEHDAAVVWGRAVAMPFAQAIGEGSHLCLPLHQGEPLVDHGRSDRFAAEHAGRVPRPALIAHPSGSTRAR